jgi:hypothetical protein
MDNEWKIIESDMGNGKKEYQVSNGNVGETFDNLPDAKTTLELINFRLELEEFKDETIS